MAKIFVITDGKEFYADVFYITDNEEAANLLNSHGYKKEEWELLSLDDAKEIKARWERMEKFKESNP